MVRCSWRVLSLWASRLILRLTAMARSAGRSYPAEVGGSVGVGFEDHPTFLDRSLVALLSVVGIGGDAQFGDPRPELTGGQAGERRR